MALSAVRLQPFHLMKSVHVGTEDVFCSVMMVHCIRSWPGPSIHLGMFRPPYIKMSDQSSLMLLPCRICLLERMSISEGKDKSSQYPVQSSPCAMNLSNVFRCGRDG